MTLLEEWRNLAYDPNKQNTRENKALWDEYFELEKGVYEKILARPGRAFKGTFRELADKFELSDMFMTGFLDGINDSLKKPNPIEEMDENTELSLGFDKEKLYKNMVHAQADWLYNLPQWDKIFTEEEQAALYKEAKNENTVRHEAPKVYPNDPCPCGSGKKYKKCCMLKEA